MCASEAAARACILIGLLVCGCVCLYTCLWLTTITRNCVHVSSPNWILTNIASASCGAVCCNRSCLWVGVFVCYHDNSKLRASILTKLGL